MICDGPQALGRFSNWTSERLLGNWGCLDTMRYGSLLCCVLPSKVVSWVTPSLYTIPRPVLYVRKASVPLATIASIITATTPNIFPVKIWSFALTRYEICNQKDAQPRTVFCKISVRKSKYCLEFSITWERLKISSDRAFHLWTIFEVYLINFLTIFWSLIFHISLPRIDFFRKKKENLKLSDSKIIKTVVERGIRKILTFITRYWFHLKFSGK